MNKFISLNSVILFLLPCIVLFICLNNHSEFKNEIFFPFFDGKVSVSLIGRQDYNIIFFKISFLIYSFLSFFFYYNFSNFLKRRKYQNNFFLVGILMNIALICYIYFLGNNVFYYSDVIRRLSIILYLLTVLVAHFLTFLFLKRNFNKFKKSIVMNISFNICLLILIIMFILIIVGSPWINPLFDYPYNLKNIIEWNYFFVSLLFYIPFSIIIFKY